MSVVARLLRTPAAAAAALLLSTACQPEQPTAITEPPPDENPTTIRASLVAADVSEPTWAPGASGMLAGRATLSGLAVELWNGSQWHAVAEAPEGATFVLGDGAAVALMPTTDLPAGAYTRARLTAVEAEIDLSLTLAGLEFSARIVTPTGRTIEIERSVAITPNPDGSQTFRLELELARHVAVAGGEVTVEGDLGVIVAAARARGAVALSDASQPTIAWPAGARGRLAGSITLSGVGIELGDGNTWRELSVGSTTATVTIGDGAIEVVVVPPTEIPAGLYTRVRLTAAEATFALKVTVNGREYTTEAPLPVEGAVVIEREIEVVPNPDGSLTIKIQIQAVRTVTVELSGEPGAIEVTVTINGDVGTVRASAVSESTRD